MFLNNDTVGWSITTEVRFSCEISAPSRHCTYAAYSLPTVCLKYY